jgi:deoxyadenosine/deoxycytidine kinase
MYILEGNIGAGKSTFLKMIAQHEQEISVGLEPINNWHTESSGQSLLKNFYENPHRWAYTLETLAMMSRIKEHQLEQQHPSRWRVVERSIYSGYYCFARNSYASGFLLDIEWNIYQEWFDFLTRKNCLPPHGFIYLQVDPVIAFERTKKRNRSAESSLSLDYLKHIDKLHNAFLLNKIGIADTLKQIPVLVLNCNEDFESNASQFDNHRNALIKFLQETAPFGQAQHTNSQISL